MVRGCVRDLKEDSMKLKSLKNDCLRQSSICKTCHGDDNCNRASEFRRCYVSEGRELPDDWRDSIKTCTRSDDKCFSFINATNFIIKDCLADYMDKRELPLLHYAYNYNQTTLYKECSTNLCNDEPIEQLRCIQCDSRFEDNCLGTALAPRVLCPLEVISSGCYHQIDGENIKRGCTRDLDKETRELCKSDTDDCKKCVDGNECNWKPFYQKCIVTNPQNASESQSKTCKRYDDECFIHVSNEIVRRGCTSDTTESKRYDINISDMQNDDVFEKCSQRDDCNKRKVKRERCIVCSSKMNGNCFYDPMSFREKCPLKVKEMGCYLTIGDDFEVERGCASELELKKRKECNTGNDNCKTCFSRFCNEKRSFQSCKVCDSEVDGDFCVSSPWQLNNRLCPNYLDQCYTHVQNGIVKRNCTGDATIQSVEQCRRNGETCKYCDDKNGCNNDEVRHGTCISCNSADDPTCASNTTFTTFEVCPLSIHIAKCYHLINETTGVHTRGEFYAFYQRIFKEI